jgi:predicted nucleic-acid-binding protein
MARIPGLEEGKGGRMIGWDTNVLLRLFTSDNPAQTAAVIKLLSGCGPASIRLTNIVIAELVGTLVRHYKRQRQEIVEIVEKLLQREELVFENRSAVMMALRWFEQGNADFGDYLIGALNDEAGAAPTFTFDRQASSNASFALVTP